MPNIFKDGGGAGIGSYVIVFKNGQMDPSTDVAKLRGAYESGDSIFVSVIDDETKDALVPASGWLDEENELHLVARDLDDGKTYTVLVGEDVTEPAEATVEDKIEINGEEIQAGVSIPEPTSEDAGKVIKVGESGEYELGEAGGGDEIGFKTIELEKLDTETTLTDFLTAADYDIETAPNVVMLPAIINYYVSAYGSKASRTSGYGTLRIFKNVYGGGTAFRISFIGLGDSQSKIVEHWHWDDINLASNPTFDTCVKASLPLLPETKSLDSSKTYSAKYSNYNVQWAEDSGSAGGTQLYKHEVYIDSSVAWQRYTIINNTETLSGTLISGFAAGYGPATNAKSGIVTSIGGVGGGTYSIEIVEYGSSSTSSQIYTSEQYRDTVTPL